MNSNGGEKPILFSGEMVRALLSGAKSQTRRIIKPQPEPTFTIKPCPYSPSGWAYAEDEQFHKPDGCTCKPVKCPYGSIGTRLWVRETWGVTCDGDSAGFKTGQVLEGQYDLLKRDVWMKHHYQATEPDIPGMRWRPSIHMPRVASRLTLEITGVKVERLQDISAADIWQEGVRPEGVAETAGDGEGDFDPIPVLYAEFEKLWDAINGDREGCDWASNPLVWAISFKRITAVRETAEEGSVGS